MGIAPFRRRPDLTLYADFHEKVGEPPEIVQQHREREVEQPDAGVPGLGFGKVRLHWLVLIFDVPATAVAVGHMCDLVGSDVIAVGHEYAIAPLLILAGRWHVQILSGGRPDSI